MPTANGGHTHTPTSEVKMAAASKGNRAWNKVKARSEETKARIAAVVQKKNREQLFANSKPWA